MAPNPFKCFASRCFYLIGSHCLCVFVCCVVEVRYDRLEAKLQVLSEFSRVPEASTVQSLPCQEIWNRKKHRGYPTCLRESNGTWRWKAGTKWEVWDKDRRAATSDCRRTLECPSSCHQALAELSNRHCFHTTWAAHLREREACGIRVCCRVIIWWTLLKCPISGVRD